jgi:hypothetical protein
MHRRFNGFMDRIIDAYRSGICIIGLVGCAYHGCILYVLIYKGYASQVQWFHGSSPIIDEYKSGICIIGLVGRTYHGYILYVLTYRGMRRRFSGFMDRGLLM